MKRIFAALEIPDRVQSLISEFTGILAKRFPDAGAKWVDAEKIHLTIRFFGGIDDSQLASVREVVRTAVRNHNTFKLTVEGTGVFPGSKRPRVLWVGLLVSSELEVLKHELDTALLAEGFDMETWAFRPHLTVARLRDPSKARRLAAEFLEKEFEPAAFEVRRLCLFQSLLKPTGSEYVLIDAAELGP